MGSLRDQFREQEASRAQKRRPAILTVTNMVIGGSVVVIVLVLALVLPKLIPKSPEQLYLNDRELIGKKVLLYTTGLSPNPVERSMPADGVRPLTGLFPIFAQAHLGLDSALKEEDVGNGEITTLGLESNPSGSKGFSATPSWEDTDGDGKRIPANDRLFYHNASPEPGVDHWNTITVTVNGAAYVVDSRDGFINIDLLVERGYFDYFPESASPDNGVHGTGSYSWYVDENGEVKSMLNSRPIKDTDGYQGVYP